MHFIGWISSAILLITIGTQVHKQWRDRSCAGVSRWLFVGQTAASLGFTIYSLQVRDWVFVVTNAMMLCSAIVGWIVLWRNLRARRSGYSGSRYSPASSGARVSSASA